MKLLSHLVPGAGAQEAFASEIGALVSELRERAKGLTVMRRNAGFDHDRARSCDFCSSVERSPLS
ncbi:MAG: hypothetical protein QNK04_17045 [Myxococcota bacterium]|nr:hypothetical protein [Myxococcota bacterium]